MEKAVSLERPDLKEKFCSTSSSERKPSVQTYIPSEPSSLLPTTTLSPFFRFLNSLVSNFSFPRVLSTTQTVSILLSVANIHFPFTLKYSGYIDRA